MASAREGKLDLLGGKALAADVVHKSMADLEQRLTAEFHERSRITAELSRLTREGTAHLQGPNATATTDGMRSLAAELRGRALAEAAHSPARAELLFAPIGAVRTPGYDYQWHWSAINGQLQPNFFDTADRTTGRMQVLCDTGDNDASSASVRAAVGIYFSPPVASGTLAIWSWPALSDTWYDICSWSSCSSDGWIGLFVAGYDSTGAPTGTLVDQKISLWSDSSWWSGTGDQYSNSGYGLTASGIPVDHDHHYAIWVWCGADIAADGWGTFSGSGAGANLIVNVPSIRWELSGFGPVIEPGLVSSVSSSVS
jgi:hypothetical protein